MSHAPARAQHLGREMMVDVSEVAGEIVTAENDFTVMDEGPTDPGANCNG